MIRRRLYFTWRYLLGRAPWDSGVAPPELLSFIEAHPPGRAIDLGCGTGTNVLALAQNGWEVTGVDFSLLAILRARRKIGRSGYHADLRVRDVTDLDDIDPPFDLALDIGCFHSLESAEQVRYVDQIARLVRSGGAYMLYTFLRGCGTDQHGLMDEEELKSLFSRPFGPSLVEHGYFKEQTSAWFTFVRRT